LKILVLSNLGMGLYKFRRELLEKLVNMGNEVYVSLPCDEYVDKLTDIGCEFVETNVDRRGKNPITDLALLKYYIKTIKDLKPDVVLSYTIKPNIFGGIACRLMNIPFMPNITGMGSAIENESLVQKVVIGLYRIALRKAEMVFFQNIPNRDYFIKKSISERSKSLLIPGSGVNLDQFQLEEYPDENDELNILYVGRVMKTKGIEELLGAAKIIRDRGLHVKIDIVGFCEEDYGSKLKSMSSEGIIAYHGQQNDVRSFIRNAHAVILPSYFEGTSNALLEAAAMGRPILASNVAGCVETFDEGITGIGFEVRNQESLIDSILKFNSLSYAKKKKMGLDGRKKMEKFYNRDIVISKYIDEIYKRR